MSNKTRAALPGRVVTFYSYKGGTGRSMALANFAWLLAANGRSVAVVDWDLEAPGLHRYFRPWLTDSDLLETDGLIDAFWQFASAAVTRSTAGTAAPSSHFASEVADALEDSTRRLNQKFVTEGYIDFICAGRQGPTYSERVNTFDWKRFYELGGAQIVGAARDYLRAKYEWVLIDSRTGVSDTSGICTIHMPDTVVACFTLNRQSVDGVAAILRSIREYRSSSVDGSKIKFFPVATRIENGEAKRLEIGRAYARRMMAEFVSFGGMGPRDYWDSMEISYRPAYAFEETLAAFGDASGATGAADTMLSQLEEVSQILTGDRTLRMPEVLDDERAAVLERYAFDGKGSQRRPASEPDNAQRGDSEFRRLVIAKEQLWRHSGFRWHLLLSRRELELITEEDRKSFGRDASSFLLQSQRGEKLVAWLNILFAFCSVVTVMVIVAVATYNGTGLWPKGLDSLRPLFAISLGLATYVLTAALSSYLVSVRGDLPYGVSYLTILSLLMRGPLRPQILDYDRSTP